MNSNIITKKDQTSLNVLFLSPHTDDGELGSGGTMIKFLAENYNVMVVVFSMGDDSLPKGSPEDTLKKEFISVMKDLGINNFITFNYKIRKLGYSRQEILEELVKIKANFSPDLVVGPSLNDFHQDHQTIASEMVRAFKTTSSIICYEMPWNQLSFNSQVFVKLDKKHIEKKCEMLNHYKSQLVLGRPYFSKEFIYGLAKVRGIQCNSEYAETFEVLRWML
jgi:LmbE family N-acetylglucosaminyl deacetylase